MKVYMIIESFLLEAKAELIAKQQGNKVMQAYKADSSSNQLQDALSVVRYLKSADPTPNQKYLQKIVNWYTQGDFKIEDVNRIRNELEKFDEIKNKLPAEVPRDIGQYKKSSDLYNVIQKYGDVESGREKKRNIKDTEADVLLNNKQLAVIVPKTENAACYYGSGTRWCTAAREHNEFETYNKDGPLFIIIDKVRDEKYQFHFESYQFMDAEDNAINPSDIIDGYPIISKLPRFRKEALQYGMFSLVSGDISEEEYMEGVYELSDASGNFHDDYMILHQFKHIPQKYWFNETIFDAFMDHDVTAEMFLENVDYSKLNNDQINQIVKFLHYSNGHLDYDFIFSSLSDYISQTDIMNLVELENGLILSHMHSSQLGDDIRKKILDYLVDQHIYLAVRILNRESDDNKPVFSPDFFYDYLKNLISHNYAKINTNLGTFSGRQYSAVNLNRFLILLQQDLPEHLNQDRIIELISKHVQHF